MQGGNLLWQYLPEGPDGSQVTPAPGEDANITTPVVANGVVYFGTSFFLPSDANGQSNYLSYLHVFGATSSQKRWVIPQQPSFHFQMGDTTILMALGD